ALCYPKNDREDIGKLGVKEKIMETMNVTFDELSAMAFEQSSSKPRLQSMTSGKISSGLDLTYAPSTITSQQPTKGELDLLFEAIYDDYIGGQPSLPQICSGCSSTSNALQTPTANDINSRTAPTPKQFSSLKLHNCPNSSQDVDELKTQQQHVQQQNNQAPL
ncbi:hypothetical protein Tco_1171550, partial [Tanacetum coccineum]